MTDQLSVATGLVYVCAGASGGLTLRHGSYMPAVRSRGAISPHGCRPPVACGHG